MDLVPITLRAVKVNESQGHSVHISIPSIRYLGCYTHCTVEHNCEN